MSEEPGLRKDALGLTHAVAIGVAGTAPSYSIAASTAAPRSEELGRRLQVSRAPPHRLGLDGRNELGLLAGELDETTAISLTTQRTLQFAKRQRTWFRRQHRPLWLSGPDQAQGPAKDLTGDRSERAGASGPEPDLVKRALAAVGQALG